MTLSDIHKELIRGEYVCHEFPSLVVHFLPGGTLRVYGERKQPFVHSYTVIHRGDQWFMDTTPHLLNEPAEMEMFMMENHLTLKSSIVDDQNNSKEELHFSKIKIKPY